MQHELRLCAECDPDPQVDGEHECVVDRAGCAKRRACPDPIDL
jgi:hypothetical protein